MVLQNTRLNLVLNMAKTIADGIHFTHLQFNLTPEKQYMISLKLGCPKGAAYFLHS